MDELQAIEKIYKMLSAFPPMTQDRMLRFLGAKLTEALIDEQKKLEAKGAPKGPKGVPNA